MQHPYGSFGVAPGGGPMGGVPRPPGKDPLSLQRGLVTAMIPLHVLMFFAECVSLALQIWVERSLRLDRASSFEQGELVGRLLAGGCFLLWGAAGFVWALVNLQRLRRPDPGAQTSLRLYWCFSALSCLCFPLGIVGLVNLSRDEVRRAFG